MKTIINYATSGLGNRLLPLGSCMAIADITGRRLKMYWDTITPNGCLASFNDLFSNEIDLLSLEELEQLKDCKLFTENPSGAGYKREADKFGRHALASLAKSNPVRYYNQLSLGDLETNIIVYYSGILPMVPLEDVYYSIRQLKPIPELQEIIDSVAGSLNLSKDVIGVHTRGTDFALAVPIQNHINSVANIVANYPNRKIFLSTDDESIETALRERFSDKIISYRDPSTSKYLSKDDPSKSWSDHTSFSITKAKAQRAVVDLFLLAKTDIKVYNPASTFAKVATILSYYHNA